MKKTILFATIIAFISATVFADFWDCSVCGEPASYYTPWVKHAYPAEGTYIIHQPGSKNVGAWPLRDAYCINNHFIYDESDSGDSEILTVNQNKLTHTWTTKELLHNVGTATWTLQLQEGN